MKKRLFSKIFIVIALLTSISVLAQTLDISEEYQSTKIEYLLKQDNGDIESAREEIEVNSNSLVESNLERRFNGRQFIINHK